MKKKTILIADDEKINRKLLKKILEKNYNVLEAEDGKQTIDVIEENYEEISAIVLDIQMPILDGYEVLTKIKENPDWSLIPVIVSSFFGSEDSEIKALSLGANDFISKPYNAEIILKRLYNTIKLRETATVINKMQRDEITGLYKKSPFIEKVEKIITSDLKKSYDLLFIGIDSVYFLIQTLGQAKVDNLLKSIASFIDNIWRKSQVIGYFETGKFMLLVDHMDKYSDEPYDKLLSQIKNYDEDITIHLYCGVYNITDRAIPVSTMCSCTELAANRNLGKYDVKFSYYDESIRNEKLKEQFIINNMQNAIESQEFQVYYQPKYDSKNGVIVGAEALVRWIHPEKGFILPGEFIPLFEKNGFITELDHYVWETVCKDMREWLDEGISSISVSINVSREDIYNTKLIDMLLDLVKNYNISIKNLHLEITESAYTSNPEQLIIVVSRLRDLGFCIEMDDFGSGYSSLNMLSELPIDILKLDMRFVQSETNKTSGKSILRFVVSLAKWLELGVIAEGVETKEQLNSLQSMDCIYVQGFYFSKPLSKANFVELLRKSVISEMVTNANKLYQEKTQILNNSKNPGMLIIDDIELDRNILYEAFKDKFNIIIANDGKDAWDKLNESYNDIQIIMLDLLMPVMDGFQFMKLVKAKKEFSNIAIIVTSQDDTNSQDRALEIGADDFIAKPYSKDIIIKRVNNVLSLYQLRKIDDKINLYVNNLKEKDLDDIKLESLISILNPYFDYVRIVDPEKMLIIKQNENDDCLINGCYSIWKKTARCSKCISTRALQNKSREYKFELMNGEYYFVIAKYVPYKEKGVVLELVTKIGITLDESIVENINNKI